MREKPPFYNIFVKIAGKYYLINCDTIEIYVDNNYEVIVKVLDHDMKIEREFNLDDVFIDYNEVREDAKNVC